MKKKKKKIHRRIEILNEMKFEKAAVYLFKILFSVAQKKTECGHKNIGRCWKTIESRIHNGASGSSFARIS